MLKSLHNIGIRGIALTLLEDYLTGRNFSVKINDTLSEENTSTYGVPQGSKLGPVLFLLYTNSMLKMMKNSTVFGYADDTGC